MCITRIEVGLPTCPISNQDVFELLGAYSSNMSPTMLGEVEAFMDLSGASQRLWRNTDDDPQRILQETTERLFQYIDKKDIKIVVWCGVTKYLAEPAHASIFCNLNNMRPEMAFDVSDGCMGWLTSLSLIDQFSSAGKDGYALIVSHEFPMGPNGAILPKSFTISAPEQLRYKLPALTLGEACTLTLVRIKTPDVPITRLEIPEGALLCTMPYRNFRDFCGDSTFIEGCEEFQSHYGDMSKLAAGKSVSLLNNMLRGMDVNLITHSYTRAFEKLKKVINFNANIINYFSEYGNTATSSIPLNIAIALKRNQLSSSRPTYAWCASAGLKIALSKLSFSPDFS